MKTREIIYNPATGKIKLGEATEKKESIYVRRPLYNMGLYELSILKRISINPELVKQIDIEIYKTLEDILSVFEKNMIVPDKDTRTKSEKPVREKNVFPEKRNLYAMDEKIPHYSSIKKTYDEYMKETGCHRNDIYGESDFWRFSAKADSSNYTEEYNISVSELQKMSIKRLQAIAQILGVAKSGNKTDLIHSITSHYDGMEKTWSEFSGQEMTPKTICQYIAETSAHEAIARSIVVKSASNPLNRQMEVCIDIVKSGFTQPIFEDIKQDIYITLYTLTMDGKISISDSGKLIFAEYEREDGTKGTYYKDVYVSLRRTLDNYKNGSSARNHDSLDDASGYQEITDYVQSALIENIESNDSVHGFFRFICTKYSKKPETYKDITHVILGKWHGMKYKEIGDVHGMNERRVKYLAQQIIPQLWYDYSHAGKGEVKTHTYKKYDFHPDKWEEVKEENGNTHIERVPAHYTVKTRKDGTEKVYKVQYIYR